MGAATKSSAASQSQDYYGTIAGLVSCGPLDFISGIVIDQSLVWPSAPEWPAGTKYVLSKKLTMPGNCSIATSV